MTYTTDGDLSSLAARAAVLAKNADTAVEVEFWSTYAVNMAREVANAALADSVWVETSTTSDEFRSMKLATIRCDGAVYVEGSIR